ncbi:Tm-1-like ATP-binding domain-containing protein [Singulisphaera sp. Ch08]|uniref:Tm-1-like ATP-binding domain-containing protein n=1 Tax=Singulisphaera sp. Ch08 TaxID=3120278 RepID=A0AAU7CFA4_9BACT
MRANPVLLVGTLDTKGHELAFVRDLLRRQGLATLIIDVGSSGAPVVPADIDREEVFQRAGTSLALVRERGDRGLAVATAAQGVARLVTELASKMSIAGIFGLGGSAGTEIATSAMRQLPFGVPKVMVSTLASGQTRPYVRGSDITMVFPVADIAGLNRLSRTALTNAALGLAGMVRLPREPENIDASRPVVAATMFGVTTPCVDRARHVLEEGSVEVIVFHATGVGGQAMEGLVRDGQIAGVLDLTTTEIADELVGGVLSAGPDRLEAAGRHRVPQVVSLGALDMVNFGPMATVPSQFAGRKFHAHNPSVTLMRTTSAENERIGLYMAEVLSRAQGPVVLLIPRRGLSALDAPGQPFHDPDADDALFSTLTRELAVHPQIRVESRDEHINDSSFATAAARAMAEQLSLRKGL